MGRLGLQGIEESDLPVNGSHQDLAKSLASLSTQTNSSEVKPKDKAKSSGKSVIDFRRKYVARKNSSVAGAYKRIACLKENRTKRKREWPIESAEISSTSDNRNIQVPPELPETCNPNCSENTGQYSAGRISSNVDEFQFFVASEDGINLLVDLDSTPSDWIKSLKNEICVPRIHLGSANNQLKPLSIDQKISDGSSGCVNSPEFCHPIHDDTPKASAPCFQPNDMNQSASFSRDDVPNLVGHDTQYCEREVEVHNSGNSLHLDKLNSVSTQGGADVEGSDERSDVARSSEDCNEGNPGEISGDKGMRPLDVVYHISDHVSQAINTEPDSTNRETQVKLNKECPEKSDTEIRRIVRRGRPRKNMENDNSVALKFRSPKRDAEGSSSSLFVSQRRSKRLKSKEP